MLEYYRAWMNSKLDLSEASVQLIELVDLSDEEIAVPA